MYELERDNPEVVWVDQIYNWANVIGQMGMGREIYRQLEGKIDAWGCSIGSAGCFLGVTLALKENGVKPYTFGVIPSEKTAEVYFRDRFELGHSIEKFETRKKIIKLMGLKKWETEEAIYDKMFKMGYPDKMYEVNSEDARNMANRLAREEGIYCGMSSGANVFVALKIAKKMKADQNIVTTIVDRRDRYLGEYPNDIYIV